MVDEFDFLYPRSRYYGQVKPENLVFNANLQEFAQRVSYHLQPGNRWEAYPRRVLQPNQRPLETIETYQKATRNW